MGGRSTKGHLRAGGSKLMSSYERELERLESDCTLDEPVLYLRLPNCF